MPTDPLTIAAGAWVWDKYGKSLTDNATSALKGRWDKFRWNDAAEKYRAKVKKLYGTMQIMGMAKPVPLEDIFTEAYLLDKPTAFSRFDIELLKKSAADPDAQPHAAKRIGGLTLVNRGENLFILGKPGAGKTTFLKYIALQAAEPDKPVIDKVPIFISLKQWADSGAELMPFIEERFDICGFPHAGQFVEELLKNGSVLVLFDGLDEVTQEGGQRDKQLLAMNNFIAKYDRTRCLITCRLAASDYSFEPFTYVEIADFTPKQIETFVANWFRNQEGERDEETSRRFLTEFEKDDNKGLRDLARTPLLLTLLCLSFSETLTFPQRRVEIYEEALDALLKKWDSSRKIKRDEIYRKLSLGHKQNMLARIAAETFEKNDYFITQPELERFITDYVKNVPPHDTNETTDGEVILKSIEAQHGIFVERAHKVYSFSHLTFQEYFTAKYIVANASKGTLTSLLKRHCADLRWREVFLLTISLLPDAGQFMATFRRGVDALIDGDQKISSFLSWANKKSAAIQANSWQGRFSYLFIEIYYSGVNAIPVHSWEFSFRLNPGLNLDYDLDFNLANAYFSACPPALPNAFPDDHARSLSLARKLGLSDLEQGLAAISVPSDHIKSEEWQEVARRLQELMVKFRDIGHEWKFTAVESKRLAKYLNATRLLQECLKLAYMPLADKEAMLNSLYLPPARLSNEPST